MNAKKDRKEIGLAVVGCGTIGKIRAVFARDYPGVGWIGVCDINESLARKVAEETRAEFLDDRLQGTPQTKRSERDHRRDR